MRSKKKNKKQKSAYRRGENAALFLRRGTVVLLIAVLLAASVLGGKMFLKQFRVKKIVITGNYHLGRDDVLNTMEVKKDDSLVKLHFGDVEKRLKQNRWIKKVAVRKQYPHTLEVKIDEAVPKALLSRKNKLYLLDRDGSILERIKGETLPFLPVIKDIHPDNRKGLSEALKFVAALTGGSDFVERESIEIGLESYGLTAHIDGEFIKVGYGSYSEKLARWRELEPEIRRRGVPIKYVDLRFKDSVIVKPLKSRKKEKNS